MAWQKRMWCSPLSGNIYFGNVNTDTRKATKGKVAVTDDAVRSVAEHLYLTGNEEKYTTNDGVKITISVKVEK
ncbi:TPA: hypothetical protein OUE28_003589 [Morganella morganii]|nr:hypothetical protein [Morganella morganii]